MKNWIQAIRQRQVPYYNGHSDTYFTGNSIVGASGTSQGNLTFLIGPDYTSPNYLKQEKIYLIQNGKKTYPDFEIHRIRNSGVFCGTWDTATLALTLVDFTIQQETFFARGIFVENKTKTPLALQIGVEIEPLDAEAIFENDGLLLKKDTTKWCFGNQETKNWAERFSFVSFQEPQSVTQTDAQFALNLSFVLEDTKTIGLYHTQFYENHSPIGYRNVVQDVQQSVTEWENWLASGTQPQKIQEQQAADTIESLLLAVKMQQNRDGGVIAGIRKYANSYVRDTHGCTRLLNATGHCAETKKIILNIHSKWEKAGFIPNWWSMGSDTFIGHSFNNDASEVTAYYAFMIRDYVACSGDASLLEKVKPSLQWAIQAQLSHLESHAVTMDFNGDETEQYCCNHDGEEYGGFVHPDYRWNAKAISFPSMVAALTSIAFYATAFGEDFSDTCVALRNRIDELFWQDELQRYAWAVWMDENGKWQAHKGHLINYSLLPLWIGATLKGEKQIAEALHCIDAISPTTGFLPNCPESMQGFCGHTLGMMLYDMVKLQADVCPSLVETILHSGILGQYGTISEFYGPNGTPNGHNCRGFEGGILGEALLSYFQQ